ncbi:MAG: hypothetical protein R6V42_08790, partial [Orrella sp.]
STSSLAGSGLKCFGSHGSVVAAVTERLRVFKKVANVVVKAVVKAVLKAAGVTALSLCFDGRFDLLFKQERFGSLILILNITQTL